MGATLEIAGLTGSYAGVLTVLRYGVPFPLPRIPALLRALSESDATEQERRELIGFGGIVCLTVGTMFQIFSVLMR